jgi:hypothetical protein
LVGKRDGERKRKMREKERGRDNSSRQLGRTVIDRNSWVEQCDCSNSYCEKKIEEGEE